MHKKYLMGNTSLDLDDINFDQHKYYPLLSYSRSKLYSVLFTRALAQKIKTGKGLTVSVNPGTVRTKLLYDKIYKKISWIIPAQYYNYLQKLSWPIYWFLTKSP
jgi:NAD(P)-dependent dehydrogenase (short-subunit alcohol dehydrogenase family)